MELTVKADNTLRRVPKSSELVLFINSLIGYQNCPLLVAGLVLLSPLTFLLPLSTPVLRLICTLSAATVIYFGNELTNKYVLGNSLFCFVGDISYSVYLYHWPTIMFIKYYAGNDTLKLAGTSNIVKALSPFLIYEYDIWKVLISVDAPLSMHSKLVLVVFRRPSVYLV